MNLLVKQTAEAFKSKFNQAPALVCLSPGRINIIGEHIDYSNGWVMPAAIDRYICFAVAADANSNTGKMYALDLNDFYDIQLKKEISPVDKLWVNYLLGVYSQLQQRFKNDTGFKLVFASNIPIGAGLSSSAALTCGFAFALNMLFGFSLNKKEIALIGQKAEHTFAGVNCGIMDQFASVFGKRDSVIQLDCNTLDYHYFDAQLTDCNFVLFDSCVKHSLQTSAYNKRRSEVEKGLAIIQKMYPDVKSYRDCTHQMLETLKSELGDVVYKRCLFVVDEMTRVLLAAQALNEKKFDLLGALLQQTHIGLSKLYEVSCDELDFLVDQTIKNKGVFGSRMMGGGFGGCTINLIKNENIPDVTANVRKLYKEEFGIEMKVYQVRIAEGIHIYKP
jgi:galactokinase